MKIKIRGIFELPETISRIQKTCNKSRNRNQRENFIKTYEDFQKFLDLLKKKQQLLTSRLVSQLLYNFLVLRFHKNPGKSVRYITFKSINVVPKLNLWHYLEISSRKKKKQSKPQTAREAGDQRMGERLKQSFYLFI